EAAGREVARSVREDTHAVLGSGLQRLELEGVRTLYHPALHRPGRIVQLYRMADGGRSRGQDHLDPQATGADEAAQLHGPLLSLGDHELRVVVYRWILDAVEPGGRGRHAEGALRNEPEPRAPVGIRRGEAEVARSRVEGQL